MSPALLSKIDSLRTQLVSSAAEANLDLQHPEVQELSRKLDKLIVLAMKKK